MPEGSTTGPRARAIGGQARGVSGRTGLADAVRALVQADGGAGRLRSRERSRDRGVARDAPVTPSTEGVTHEELDQEPRRSFFARLAHLNAGLNFPVPRDPEDLRDHAQESPSGRRAAPFTAALSSAVARW